LGPPARPVVEPCTPAPAVAAGYRTAAADRPAAEHRSGTPPAHPPRGTGSRGGPYLLASELHQQPGRRADALVEMIQPEVLVRTVLPVVGVRVGHHDRRELEEIRERPERHAAPRGRHDDRRLAGGGP